MSRLDEKILINQAIKARLQAYTPYSNFKVGAAVLTKAGKIYTGCNIENAAYPLTCCAERVALFNAISAGENMFTAIAIVAETEKPVSPCGSCRQVMGEFFTKETKIILSNLTNDTLTLNIEDLLPFSFGKEDLNKR